MTAAERFDAWLSGASLAELGEGSEDAVRVECRAAMRVLMTGLNTASSLGRSCDEQAAESSGEYHADPYLAGMAAGKALGLARAACLLHKVVNYQIIVGAQSEQ
jgi:hypothetical protein